MRVEVGVGWKVGGLGVAGVEHFSGREKIEKNSSKVAETSNAKYPKNLKIGKKCCFCVFFD